MDTAGILYLIVNLVMVTLGLSLVGMAAQAYLQTERVGMLHLAIGFSLIVAATGATAISALVTNFSDSQSLLIVHGGFSTVGYLAIMYSLLTY